MLQIFLRDSEIKFCCLGKFWTLLQNCINETNAPSRILQLAAHPAVVRSAAHSTLLPVPSSVHQDTTADQGWTLSGTSILGTTVTFSSWLHFIITSMSQSLFLKLDQSENNKVPRKQNVRRHSQPGQLLHSPGGVGSGGGYETSAF